MMNDEGWNELEQLTIIMFVILIPFLVLASGEQSQPPQQLADFLEEEGILYRCEVLQTILKPEYAEEINFIETCIREYRTEDSSGQYEVVKERLIEVGANSTCQKLWWEERIDVIGYNKCFKCDNKLKGYIIAMNVNEIAVNCKGPFYDENWCYKHYLSDRELCIEIGCPFKTIRHNDFIQGHYDIESNELFCMNGNHTVVHTFTLPEIKEMFGVNE